MRLAFDIPVLDNILEDFMLYSVYREIKKGSCFVRFSAFKGELIWVYTDETVELHAVGIFS